jgi:hypothetical protein
MFATVHDEVRRAIVSRFPFAVFYVVEPKGVVVLRSYTQRVIQNFGLAQGKSRANPAFEQR